MNPRVYLDAVIVIYVVEQNPNFAPAAEAALAVHGGDLISSELAWMESLVLPYRANDTARVADFEDFFRFQLVEVLGFTRAVFDRAARIRADYGFKAPDSLHLAVAGEGCCDVFVTNDHRLDKFTGLRVELI